MVFSKYFIRRWEHRLFLLSVTVEVLKWTENPSCCLGFAFICTSFPFHSHNKNRQAICWYKEGNTNSICLTLFLGA